jgi:uracil-DNA glycosylase family 4
VSPSRPGKPLAEPPLDCTLCPRLATYLADTRIQHPDWYNAPVPSFGDPRARLLIVGLAPGITGANRTGRPFTGDFAGDLLYETLDKYGFSRGSYSSRPDDGLELVDCMITNAVRCVPPQNKPNGSEIKTCRRFLEARIEALPGLAVILALGRIAHDSTISALGLKRSATPFGHNAHHKVPGSNCDGQELVLFDSYHCSRYNTNTRRLTPQMFEQVFQDIRVFLDG